MSSGSIMKLRKRIDPSPNTKLAPGAMKSGEPPHNEATGFATCYVAAIDLGWSREVASIAQRRSGAGSPAQIARRGYLLAQEDGVRSSVENLTEFSAAIEIEDAIVIDVDRRFRIVVTSCISGQRDRLLVGNVRIARAEKTLHPGLTRLEVHRCVDPGFLIDAAVKLILLHVGKDLYEPTKVFANRFVADWPGLIDNSGWQMLRSKLKIVNSQSELHHVVGTTASSRGFPSGLNSRQKKSDEDSDDGDDHQQFDKCERVSALPRNRSNRFHGLGTLKFRVGY
jgi:hypothetical protein